MGNALKDQGKLEEAIEAYNKALAIKPDYVDAYYNMGNALEEKHNLEEAIEAYNKALASSLIMLRPIIIEVLHFLCKRLLSGVFTIRMALEN